MNAMIIKGWASTDHINSYDYAVAPHAFAKFIETTPLENIPLLLSHEPHRPAGRVITLETRPDGLWIEAGLDPALTGVPARIKQIKDKKPYGFSVGIGECRAYIKPCGTPFIYKATLREVSLTDSPSNRACSMVSFTVINDPSPKFWPADFIELFAEQAPRVGTFKPTIPAIRYHAPKPCHEAAK